MEEFVIEGHDISKVINHQNIIKLNIKLEVET